MRRELEKGERVHLVPRTLAAPAACYKQPRVTVERVAQQMATVLLDSGERVEVHVDNVVRNPPKPPKERPAPTRRPLDLPNDMEEVTLW